MMASVYYNENNKEAAARLRGLIAAGLIPQGHIDERSIRDVQPGDLDGFIQCHFFAGIGGWPLALQRAGWPLWRPVWTGSCPCQPFSVAGKQAGFDDPRHLWPEWKRLIDACRPPVIFGEQVAGAGKSGSPDLQRMRDREAVERVLCQFEVSQDEVQRLLQPEEIDPEIDGIWTSRAQPRGLHLSADTQSEISMCGCQAQSKSKGDSIRTGFECGGPSGDHQCGPLRIDGDSLQFEGRQNLGQPFFGSDTTRRWIHQEERPGCPRLRQSDGQRMGSEQDNRNSRCDPETEIGQVGRAAGQNGGGAKEEANWINLVRSDLGSLGYSLGCMPIEAASAGADHYRDRYWFVADSDGQLAGEGRIQRSGQFGRTSCDQENHFGALADSNDAKWRPEKSEWNHSDGYQSEWHEGDGHASECRDANRSLVNDPSIGWGEGWTEHEFRSRGFTAAVASIDDCQYIECPDGKWRRLPPPRVRWLGNGIPARVARLREFGNAIDPRPATEFIAAYLDIGRASA